MLKKDAQFTQSPVTMREKPLVGLPRQTCGCYALRSSAVANLSGQAGVNRRQEMLNTTSMKPTKTKRELREELDQQMNEYLNHGGAVNEVPRGISGRENANAPLVSIFEGHGAEDRTPLPEVVAAIEARRKPQLTASKTTRRSRPRKKIILDDFGQPLRWEWVEDP